MESKIEKIYNDFHQQLKFFILKRIKNESDVEDILQDVFLKIHTHVESLKEEEKLVSWLYQITRNAVVDFYRKQATLPIVSDAYFFENLPHDLQEEKSILDDMVRCLRPMLYQLPVKYKEALEFTEYQNHSQKELSEKIGISFSGAKSRVQRARKLLQNLLEDCCHLEFDSRGNLQSYQCKRDSHC